MLSDSHWKEIVQCAESIGLNGLTAVNPYPNPNARTRYKEWLAKGYAGDMTFLEKHQAIRHNPSDLLPNVQQALIVRIPYLSTKPSQIKSGQLQSACWSTIKTPELGYISLYARGRDYHKVVRKQLIQLTEFIKDIYSNEHPGESLQCRVVCDSAPVMEVELASQMPDAWRGKHTLLLHKNEGSLFFLGAILCDKVIHASVQNASQHCGTCQRCIDVCPTQAIVAPYELNATRCIAYLTIEHKGGIPKEFRYAIGNRIYGCDDCQLICPWNKYAKPAIRTDFSTRLAIFPQTICNLARLNEKQFLTITEGSAIRRIGYWRWQRNLIIAMGNALAKHQQTPNSQTVDTTQPTKQPLAHRKAITNQLLSMRVQWQHDSILTEHIGWALEQSS